MVMADRTAVVGADRTAVVGADRTVETEEGTAVLKRDRSVPGAVLIVAIDFIAKIRARWTSKILSGRSPRIWTVTRRGRKDRVKLRAGLDLFF
jgi:hypothetical protein